jgi:hypothetical protein
LLHFVRAVDLDRTRKQSLRESVPEVYDDVVKRLGRWPNTGSFTTAPENDAA